MSSLSRSLFSVPSFSCSLSLFLFFFSYLYMVINAFPNTKA